MKNILQLINYFVKLFFGVIKYLKNYAMEFYLHKMIFNELHRTVFIRAEFSYDAWGRMRNPNNWTDYSMTSSNSYYFLLSCRGYTGHEHLVEFDLINANGRIYDPTLGQFMQPDNYVQMPEYAQSYNRYAYCLNNPLKYTDPSGEFVAEAIMIGSIIYSAVQGANSVYHAYNWGGLGSAITAMHAGAMSTGLSFALGSIFNGIGTELLGDGMKGWQGIAFNIGTSPIKSFLSSTIMSGGNSKYELSQFGLDLLYSAGWAAVGLAASAIDNAYFNDVASNTAANGVDVSINPSDEGTNLLFALNQNNNQSNILDPLPNKGKNVDLPPFDEIWKNYPFGNKPTHPHPDPDYTAQCAIRTSFTLKKSGTDLSTLSNYGNLTKPAKSIYGDVGGLARGARALGNWLSQEFKAPKVYSYQQFITESSNLRGIFLEFPVSGGMYHIDLINRGKVGSGFYKTNQIWFWPLRNK